MTLLHVLNVDDDQLVHLPNVKLATNVDCIVLGAELLELVTVYSIDIFGSKQQKHLPFTVELPLHVLALLPFEFGWSVLWKLFLGPPYISCLPSISIGPFSRYFYGIRREEGDLHSLNHRFFTLTIKVHLHMHFVVEMYPNKCCLNAQKQLRRRQLKVEFEMPAQ